MCSKHNLLFIFFFSLESFPETFTGYLVETRDVRQECDPVGSCKKKKKSSREWERSNTKLAGQKVTQSEVVRYETCRTNKDHEHTVLCYGFTLCLHSALVTA